MNKLHQPCSMKKNIQSNELLEECSIKMVYFAPCTDFGRSPKGESCTLFTNNPQHSCAPTSGAICESLRLHLRHCTWNIIFTGSRLSGWLSQMEAQEPETCGIYTIWIQQQGSSSAEFHHCNETGRLGFLHTITPKQQCCSHPTVPSSYIT